MAQEVRRGSCLCGAVRFEVTGPLRAVAACHCGQCRKVSGHYWAATSAPREAVRVVEDRGLKWFRSSDKARRGFCGQCGATLFWDPFDEPRWSISPGAFDDPTDVRLERHIYCADKGDYYDIPNDAPHHG